MASRMKLSAFSAAVAIWSCVAVLIPSEASANRPLNAPRVIQVSRAQPQRSSQFRPRIQSRFRVGSRPSVSRRMGSGRPAVRPQIAARHFPTNHHIASAKNFRLQRFGAGGSSRPFKVTTLPRPGSLGVRPSIGGSATTRPFNIANLPRANSLGAPRMTGTAPRPFNVADLPKANSLAGGTHQGGKVNALAGPTTQQSNIHALAKTELKSNVAAGGAEKFGADKRQLKDDKASLKSDKQSISSDTKDQQNAQSAFDKAKSSVVDDNNKLIGDLKNNASRAQISQDEKALIGATENRALASDRLNDAQQKLKTDAKAEASARKAVGADKQAMQQDKVGANVNRRAGAVVAAKEDVGGDKAQLKDDKTALKKDDNAVTGDKKTVANDQLVADKASKAFLDAQNKLDDDFKNHASARVISVDGSNAQFLGGKNVDAVNALNDANQKLSLDQKAQASDTKAVGSDKKVLAQDKSTLGDKQKILQQSNEIQKLKTASQASNGSGIQPAGNGPGSSGQSSDNGNGSSVQSDPGQGLSTSAGNTQVASAGVGTVSGGSTSTSVVAGVAPVVGGAALAARAGPVLPIPAVVPFATQPPPVAIVPGPATPDVIASINPTFVMVGFQKDISNDNVTAFLQAYDATITEGPNADGLYKLQLAAVPAGQVQQVVDSMKSQTNIVASAVVN